MLDWSCFEFKQHGMFLYLLWLMCIVFRECILRMLPQILLWCHFHSLFIQWKVGHVHHHSHDTVHIDRTDRSFQDKRCSEIFPKNISCDKWMLVFINSFWVQTSEKLKRQQLYLLILSQHSNCTHSGTPILMQRNTCSFYLRKIVKD